ncbi:MAG TPA: tetratricopeptide repeat protein [Blastocatellia bacterium]|jgi:tetratricopeptide (TPR) repeat protein
MIICNNCGTDMADGMRFCVECGAAIPGAASFDPPPDSHAFDYGRGGAAPARAPVPSDPMIDAPPIIAEPIAPPSITTPIQARSSNKAIIGLLGIVAVAAIAIAVFFALRDTPESRLVKAMNNSVASGRVVSATDGDDAYSYYKQLRALDPTHGALKDIAPKVLPQLKSMGEDVFRRKMAVMLESLTSEDWMKTMRAYEWATALEPADKQNEARWKFAEAETAKIQGRRDDAERGFATATRISPSWALPQNSLGLLRMESKRYADSVPYFQKAIDLQSNWEIPYSNMGTAYFYQKDYDTAESWYQRASQMNPRWARPHFWLGSIYEYRKWYPQAIDEYETALSLGPDYLPADANVVRQRIEKLRALIQ